MSILMYQIKFEGDARYEPVLYKTREEAEEIGKSVGLRYRIRAVRVCNQ